MNRLVALVSVVVLLLTSVTRSAFACDADADCKGDRICADGECHEPSVVIERPAKPPKVKKRFVRPGLFYGGIVVAAMTPIAIFVAAIAALDQTGCESEARDDAFARSDVTADDAHCSNYNGTIMAGVGGVLVFGIVGTVMIVAGAKRVPIDQPDDDAKLKLVPWSEKNAGGAALRFRF
ncbi:MAG: hypothetical protein ABI551_08755 [Polyangiaceae bacterium]